MNASRIVLAAGLLLFGLVPALAALPPGETLPQFEKANADWRAWRLQRLTAADGWLTLIGLDWLEPGDNRLGSCAACKLHLPADKAPAELGTIRLEEGAATLLPRPGTSLTADGKPVAGPLRLATDAQGDPTALELGSLDFYVIQRGAKLGLRVRDRDADLRLHFPGLDYFPPDPNARVVAKFTPNPPGTTLPVVDIVGVTEQMPSPGKLTFELQGQTFTITALDDTGDGRLYLIVGDQTNVRETYGGGRFLYADPPRDGVTVVDFNRAYNPPCAFTPYSTCQLPPRENRLPIRIEAGEKRFADEAGHP